MRGKTWIWEHESVLGNWNGWVLRLGESPKASLGTCCLFQPQDGGFILITLGEAFVLSHDLLSFSLNMDHVIQATQDLLTNVGYYRGAWSTLHSQVAYGLMGLCPVGLKDVTSVYQLQCMH